MRLWQAPARALPATLRPFGGETVVSYTRRLGEANDLGPTAVLRALGEVAPGTGRHVLDKDAVLNDAALDRLAALSGLPRARLEQALPALRSPRAASLPTHRPALRWFRPRPAPQPACQACTTRRASTPALVHTTWATRVCYRHRRWLDGRQVDLAAIPAIVQAHTRCRHFLAASPGEPWTSGIATLAGWLTLTWAHGDPSRHPALAQRWQARAQRIGTSPAHPAVRLPETVALAHVLADLDWRRHVAMVRDYQMDAFYRHVARETGATAAALADRRRPDHITWWVHQHRAHFADLRDRFYADARLSWRSLPFPEKGQFQ